MTPWLRVDIRRPVTGTSGVIVFGSREEVFYAKVHGRWVRLGVGHASNLLSLAGDQAMLIDLHDGKGLQLVREDAAPQRVPDAFGHRGEVTVPPEKEAIDVFDCSIPATPAGCREAQIFRHDLAGTSLASFPVALPVAYSDCQPMRIIGYDKERIPYVFAQCRMDSTQAKSAIVA